jgi:2,3-bisphosphoglycerate-dependent phosphoglycerate mutase
MLARPLNSALAINMKNLYVITHTQSIHHIEKKVGGWYDTGLTEYGKRQAIKVAQSLEHRITTEPVTIFSSDLKRAAETAAIIGEVFKQNIIFDSDLRELSYGIAEGREQSWLSERISYTPKDGNRLDHRVCKNSESRKEIGSRIEKSIARILNEMNKNAIVVTHGFALTFIIMSWLKIPVSNMNYCNFSSTPGGITLLQEGDVFENRNVKFINNTEHIKR